MYKPSNVCSAQALGARLASGEGLPGLLEWAGQLRGALTASAEVTKIKVDGFGTFTVTPGGGKHALLFVSRQTLKNCANGDPQDRPDSCDEVVAAIYDAVAAGHDAIELPQIGTLRIEAMEAYTGSDFDGNPVEHGAKKLVKFKFDPGLLRALD